MYLSHLSTSSRSLLGARCIQLGGERCASSGAPWRWAFPARSWQRVGSSPSCCGDAHALRSHPLQSPVPVAAVLCLPLSSCSSLVCPVLFLSAAALPSRGPSQPVACDGSGLMLSSSGPASGVPLGAREDGLCGAAACATSSLCRNRPCSSSGPFGI